jgi:hypothetical protein
MGLKARIKFRTHCGKFDSLIPLMRDNRVIALRDYTSIAIHRLVIMTGLC